MRSKLPSEVLQRLHNGALLVENVDWPGHIVRKHGWSVANKAYLAAQEKLGREEMEALLSALRMSQPVDGELLRQLLLTAVDVFLHTDRISAEGYVVGGDISVKVSRCPIYDKFVTPHWFGLTVCGCFSRRKGWYDALGVNVHEDLVMNRKWGDPICELVILLSGREASTMQRTFSA